MKRNFVLLPLFSALMFAGVVHARQIRPDQHPKVAGLYFGGLDRDLREHSPVFLKVDEKNKQQMEISRQKHLFYLQRSVDLAKKALERGNNPFGTVLVSGSGEILFEDHNRDGETGNAMMHPELAVAQWAAKNMSLEERSKATVYTSGEHCAMCAAAHAWAGLNKIYFASSTEQLEEWFAEFKVPPSALSFLPIRVVAPGIEAEGPFKEFTAQIYALQKKRNTQKQ